MIIAHIWNKICHVLLTALPTCHTTVRSTSKCSFTETDILLYFIS